MGVVNGGIVAVLLAFKLVPRLTVGTAKADVRSVVAVEESDGCHCRHQTTGQTEVDHIARSFGQVSHQKLLHKRAVSLGK